MQKIRKLPETELEIMQSIWKAGKTLSTAEIKMLLEERRSWNLSALQTLLHRLTERGFLESKKEGKHRFYRALLTEEAYLAVENRSFLERVNHRSVTKLVASLYESNAISDADLEELAVFIRQKTKGE